MTTFDPETVTFQTISLVDGRTLCGQGDEIPVLRPSDGREMATMRACSHSDVDEAVVTADHVYKTVWSKQEPRHRAMLLRKWADRIDGSIEQLARLESLGSSRTITETLGRDISVCADIIRFYAECADKTQGEVLTTAPERLHLVEAEPYGVVAAIAPWNVPLLLATVKIAPALAAGNTVVVKPSELTPFSLVALAQLAFEAGLPAGALNVVLGGAQTGDALVRHSDVKFVTFTGSTKVGASIMAAAASSGIKPVALELGGKNPQVVFDDHCGLEAVADAVTLGAVANSGQLCFAGSRLIVAASVAEQLTDAIVKRLEALRPGATWQQTTTLPPLISRREAERIEGVIHDATCNGAELRTGGELLENGGGAFIRPAILVNVGPGAPALQDEIFGPVLTVQTFEDFDEAVALAGHEMYGLAMGIHTRDINKALRLARQVETGTVWINTYGRGRDVSSPFGGYGSSGFGKDFGQAGYAKYLRHKSINIAIHA